MGGIKGHFYTYLPVCAVWCNISFLSLLSDIPPYCLIPQRLQWTQVENVAGLGERLTVRIKRKRSSGLLLLTKIIEVLLPPSFAVKIYVSLYACGTQMTDRFTTADMLQAEPANHTGAVSNRGIKKSPDFRAP